jgi:hypothetical protein
VGGWVEERCAGGYGPGEQPCQGSVVVLVTDRQGFCSCLLAGPNGVAKSVITIIICDLSK